MDATANWIALASAAVALFAMASTIWQAVSARQQARSAKNSAESADRSASAAERQAFAAEQQLTLDRVDRAAYAADRVRRALKNVLVEITKFDPYYEGRSEDLLAALGKMQDETVNAASIASSPELQCRLNELRELAKSASEARGIERDYRIGGVGRVRNPDDTKERRLRIEALAKLKEFIVAFLADEETPNR
jgi:hypothetical protein